MIPLKDMDRRPARFPLVTTLIIGINILVFVLEILKGARFVDRWSFVPHQISEGKNLVTIWTSMFMHGGIVHILGNMVYLWAFGPEIEDQLGKTGFILFYLAGGTVAALAQTLIAPDSTIPTLGASGAIASVMGAFIISFPRDRIRTIIFFGFFFTISLLPAIFLVGFWFIIQLFSEAGSIFERRSGGGIAYMAHIGGFVFGMITAGVLARSRKTGGNAR